MSKLTLEIPDSLHRAVKSIASAHGETIRSFFIEAVTEKLKQTSKLKTAAKVSVKNSAKPLVKAKEKTKEKTLVKLSKKTTTKNNMKNTKKKNPKYITEKEADKMLKPYILRMIKRIKSGQEEAYSKEEFFKKLREEN